MKRLLFFTFTLMLVFCVASCKKNGAVPAGNDGEKITKGNVAMETLNYSGTDYSQRLLERFLRYVKIESTSDEANADKGIQPSTDTQWKMAEILESELKALLNNGEVITTKNCYVVARLSATEGLENLPCVGFLAHVDTSDSAPGKNVNPQLVEQGGDTIIKTDGATLLGADDKAGIAEIMTALDIIINEKIPHGEIEVIFSPDEETGHGMDNIPLEIMHSKYCYTVDGGTCGEIECECFNAYKTTVNFTGIASHTGTAYGVMKNAVMMASEFVESLPKKELPETTKDYDGFYAPLGISGSLENASVELLLRDFSAEGMEKRKSFIDSLARKIESEYEGSVVTVKHAEQYRNMKETLDKSPFVMENLIAACKKVGVEPVIKPIRGGTDGSHLTRLGIPTPNIFTGGHEFHSRSEWASLNEMCLSVKTIVELTKIISVQ